MINAEPTSPSRLNCAPTAIITRLELINRLKQKENIQNEIMKIHWKDKTMIRMLSRYALLWMASHSGEFWSMAAVWLRQGSAMQTVQQSHEEASSLQFLFSFRCSIVLDFNQLPSLFLNCVNLDFSYSALGGAHFLLLKTNLSGWF